VQVSFVTTEDGLPLFVRSKAPSGKPKGVAVLLHAMMADGRSLWSTRRDSLGGSLLERGWVVCCPDFRGHGGSSRGHPRRRPWGYHDLVRFDVPAVLGHVRQQFAGSPIVVFGHSLGGHVAAASVLGGYTEEPDAWALLAVNLWEPYPGHSRRLAAVKHLMLACFEGLSHQLGYFPARRLRIGPVNEATPYVSDLVRFWRSGTWGPRGGEDYRRGGIRLEAPIVGVNGEADRLLAPLRDSAAWVGSLSAGQEDLWLARTGHFGLTISPDHTGVACNPACRPLWEALETRMTTIVSGRPASSE
jgi:predicted alpha/beta hydrolase